MGRNYDSISCVSFLSFRVPLSTLEKCHTALKGLFRKELSASNYVFTLVYYKHIYMAQHDKCQVPTLLK